MTRALSVDLRNRLIGAIEEGASCRQAATRFGVSASSAIRWPRAPCSIPYQKAANRNGLSTYPKRFYLR